MVKSTYWDYFIKYEEYNKSDKLNRFLYDYTTYKNVDQPIISRFLAKTIEPFWPENKEFCLCLTHDIDCLKPNHFQKINIKPYKKILMKISPKFSSAWDFSNIINIEKKFGGKSSFFILALSPNELDFNYHLEEIVDEIKIIEDEGFDIGLHGGHSAFRDNKKMAQEKEKLSQYVKMKIWGYRNHCLKFDIPLTYYLLESCNFKYDSTYGYPDRIGFRNGLCYPFYPFDIIRKRYFNILEIPLTIMDATLFHYMKLDINAAWIHVKRLIDNTRICNGVITILWHNTYFYGDYLKFYLKLLSYANENSAWIIDAKTLYHHWTSNFGNYIKQNEDILKKEPLPISNISSIP